VLVIGSENTRRHPIREILLTLMMLNSPAEIRVALMGTSVKMYEDLAASPHMLGRMVDEAENGIRLLDGMVKEVERRRQWFQERETDTFDDYNAALLRQNEQPLSRILLVIDSLSDPAWQEVIERWLPSIYDLLVNGAQVGVHLIVTANQLQAPDVPEMLENALEMRIIMRSASPELAESVKNFHSSALRFIDAFLVDKRQSPEIIPVELCAITDDEAQRLSTYWRQMATQRAQEPKPRERRTGLTDLLPPLDDPSRQAAPLPTRTRVGTLARATQALSSNEEDRILGQAQALAAYLGWIGIGPLRDVLGLPTGEARAILAALQSIGVIETGDGPVLRFVRLADNPLPESQE
jgi:hypothetical protein